jgi:Arc/MetJ-type ribon-helix-helix transcriptional regulator
MVAEDIGIAERRINFRFYNLSESDVEIVERLTEKIGIRSPSAVIRNAIEALIDRYNLAQFQKPEGWRSRPLTLKVAGSQGLNPVAKLSHPTKYKCVSIPMRLWHKLPTEDNFSGFVREAIDKCDRNTLTPLSKEDLHDDKRRITLLLYEYQIHVLEQIKRDLPHFHSEGQVILSILKQASLEGAIAPKGY